MTTFKLVSSYIIIALYVVAFFILLGLVSHLLYISRKKRKNKTGNKGLQFFIVVTVFAIISFELTCIGVIFVVLQIILIDAHALHQDIHWIDHIYYESFDEMEFLIPICDNIAHLCVVVIFIGRFQYTFKNGPYLVASKNLISVLYTLLVLLFSGAVGIIALIVLYHKTYYIIISEIAWETVVEFLCLWILYLFMTRLYKLLKMSLNLHMHKNKDKTSIDQNEFFKELTKTIHSYTDEKSKSSHEKCSNNDPKNKNKSPKSSPNLSPQNSCRSIPHLSHQNSHRMTIDGRYVEPVIFPIQINTDTKTNVELEPNHLFKNNAPISEDNICTYSIKDIKDLSNPCESPTSVQSTIPSPDPEIIELTITKTIATTAAPHNTSSRTLCTSKDNIDSHNSIPNISRNSSKKLNVDMNGTMDLVTVMNKMSLLVLFAAFCSILSMIGNVFIEIHELETIEKHDIDMQSIWAELLPLIDIVVTSFMLYLQFNFADGMYRKLLGKLDVLFLKQCLTLIKYVWYNPREQKKAASFINK